MRAYGLGIVFYAGIKVAATAFHARGDMRRPMFASLVGIGVNVLTAVFGTRVLGFAAMPLATAFGAFVNYGILRGLDRGSRGPGAAPGGGFLVRVVLATAVLGAFAFAVGRALLTRGAPLGHGLLLVAGLFVTIVSAAAVYFVLAAWLRIEEASFARRLWSPRPRGQSPGR